MIFTLNTNLMQPYIMVTG